MAYNRRRNGDQVLALETANSRPPFKRNETHEKGAENPGDQSSQPVLNKAGVLSPANPIGGYSRPPTSLPGEHHLFFAEFTKCQVGQHKEDSDNHQLRQNQDARHGP